MPARKSASGRKARKKAVRKKVSAKRSSLKRATEASAASRKRTAKERLKAAAAASIEVVEMGDPPEPPVEVSIEEATQYAVHAAELLPADAYEAELANPGLAHCPACRQLRPVTEFMDVQLQLDPNGPVPACLTCRERGIPVVQVVPGLDPRTAYAIRRRAEGTTLREIAIEMGTTPNAVKQVLQGDHLEGSSARYAFKQALQVMGVDGMALARKGVELMGAQKVLTHKGEISLGKDGRPIRLEDNATQTAAWKHLTGLSDLAPPKQLEVEARGVIVHTNLDEDHPDDRSGELTATVPR